MNEKKIIKLEITTKPDINLPIFLMKRYSLRFDMTFNLIKIFSVKM